jgi:hypothetical protein
MKKQLQKKFYTCLPKGMAFIVTAMMLSASANAQIVYTDVNPDVSLSCTVSISNPTCSSMDSVDINNDGVFDLILTVGGNRTGILQNITQSGYVKATPLNGSSIISTSGHPLHMYRNDSIKSNSNWSMAANQLLESVSHSTNQIGNTVSGNWTPPIDGFLGIKIISGSQTNYGWIRLSVGISPPTATCIYKEFGYNATPNQPILAGQSSSTIIIGPIVNIPDPAFKSALVNNASINTDIDREIQVTEATAFTGILFISGATISNLTGLEAFTAIDSLYIYYTGVTSLDVTSNTALVYLTCENNQLTSLDVSANTALTQLRCDYNQLTSLDLSANTALTYLHCTHNQLTSLDVSANAALTALYCYYNQLTSLDVSSNMALSILYINNNALSSLIFSTNLTFLACEYNQLSSIDVSANTALWDLVCNHNQLTSLNVQNGNNANFFYFDAAFNPNLTCIQVDNVGYSNANWSGGKDASAHFSTNCDFAAVPAIDNLATVQIFPNPASNYLTIALGINNKKVEVTITDITGKIIYTTIATDTQKIAVNTNDFAKGIYVVQIQTADFMMTKKLVIEK